MEIDNSILCNEENYDINTKRSSDTQFGQKNTILISAIFTNHPETLFQNLCFRST